MMPCAELIVISRCSEAASCSSVSDAESSEKSSRSVAGESVVADLTFVLTLVRYDYLLEHFKEPAQQMQYRKVYGVGMSIAVE